MKTKNKKILPLALAVFAVNVSASETNAYDYYHKKVSHQIDHYSTSLDSFLTKAELDYEKVNKESYGSVTLEQKYRKGKLETSVGVKLKLDLPKTKKKYRLIIKSESDKERDITEKETPANRDLDSEDFLVGINYIAGEFNNWDTDYGFGLKTRLPINPFFEARAERSFELNSVWDGSFKQEVKYYKEEKLETESRLFFENQVSSNQFLSFTTYIDWTEEHDTMEYAQIFSFRERFNAQAEGVFETGISGSSLSHGKINKLYIGYSFRKFLYKNKIIGTLSPEMVAEREDDFEVFPNVTAKVNFIF